MTTRDTNDTNRTNEWSVPETEVFERIRSVLAEGAEAVLATVVAVEGSAYRRPGAKMLITPEGGTGSVTAGCLEDEVRKLASDVLADGTPRVETWDLTGDDDVWGMGVGCNGVITVLLEPLSPTFEVVTESLERGDDIGVVTVVGGDLPTGRRDFYRPGEGFTEGRDGDDQTENGLPTWFRTELADVAEQFVADGDSDTFTVDASAGAGHEDDGAGSGETRTVEVFVDGVRAPPKLVVFGSGHDVGPVVELSKLVDFHVTVVSFRGGQADPDRFPRADEVLSASPRDVRDVVDFDDDTYAVVMSHNFLDDRLALAELLETPVPYIGLMGPRERFEEMEEDFAEEGVTFEAATLDRIHTPVGLSLGGDAPYQIAYSIVAELLAVAHDRKPEHLTAREGPIHDRHEAVFE